MYILHICTHTSGLPCCPDREGSRMRPLVLPVFELLRMSVICQLCLYVVYTCALCTCLLGTYLQFCYWLDLGMWQQTCLPWAVGSSEIYIPPIHPTVSIWHIQLM